MSHTLLNVSDETLAGDERALVALYRENTGPEECRIDAIRERFESAEKRRNGEKR